VGCDRDPLEALPATEHTLNDRIVPTQREELIVWPSARFIAWSEKD
jgi:hypothetical protein